MNVHPTCLKKNEKQGRQEAKLPKPFCSQIENKIWKIDNLDIDGSYIESQAFGYLAIRSYLELPISFPETTGCKKPCTGGVKTKNY